MSHNRNERGIRPIGTFVEKQRFITKIWGLERLVNYEGAWFEIG